MQLAAAATSDGPGLLEPARAIPEPAPAASLFQSPKRPSRPGAEPEVADPAPEEGRGFPAQAASNMPAAGPSVMTGQPGLTVGEEEVEPLQAAMEPPPLRRPSPPPAKRARRADPDSSVSRPSGRGAGRPRRSLQGGESGPGPSVRPVQMLESEIAYQAEEEEEEERSRDSRMGRAAVTVDEPDDDKGMGAMPAAQTAERTQGGNREARTFQQPAAATKEEDQALPSRSPTPNMANNAEVATSPLLPPAAPSGSQAQPSGLEASLRVGSQAAAARGLPLGPGGARWEAPGASVDLRHPELRLTSRSGGQPAAAAGPLPHAVGVTASKRPQGSNGYPLHTAGEGVTRMSSYSGQVHHHQVLPVQEQDVSGSRDSKRPRIASPHDWNDAHRASSAAIMVQAGSASAGGSHPLSSGGNI